MSSIFRMDLRRLLHSPIFYVSLAFVTVMAVALVISGGLGGEPISFSSMMGTVSTGNTGDDFMMAAMGPGVTVVLAGIAMSAFTCGDYSSGAAKGIFSFHANPLSYLGGRMASMSLFSLVLLVLYVIEALVVLTVIGPGVALPGGVMGLLAFMVEKQLAAMAFLMIILFVCVALRNHAVGVIFAFLLATGGLSMGLPMLAEAFHLPFLSTIYTCTISGASQGCSLVFGGGSFLRLVLVSLCWGGAFLAFSRSMLLARDV